MSNLDSTMDGLVVRAEALAELTREAIAKNDYVGVSFYAGILAHHTEVLATVIRERAERPADTRRAF